MADERQVVLMNLSDKQSAFQQIQHKINVHLQFNKSTTSVVSQYRCEVTSPFTSKVSQCYFEVR